jgi:hypothetical protein
MFGTVGGFPKVAGTAGRCRVLAVKLRTEETASTLQDLVCALKFPDPLLKVFDPFGLSEGYSRGIPVVDISLTYP